MHATVEPCKSCHALMDPIGFGFENYDGVGPVANGLTGGRPVDASGTLTASDVNGPFNGAIDLAGTLSKSQEVSDCMAVQCGSGTPMGRGETTDDACSLASLKQSFPGRRVQHSPAARRPDPDRYLPLQTGGPMNLKQNAPQSTKRSRGRRRARRHGLLATTCPKQRPPSQTPPHHVLGERDHLQQLGAAGDRDELHAVSNPLVLAPYQQKLLILDGINVKSAGFGPGDDHMKGMGHMLTGIEFSLSGTTMGGAGTPAGFAGGMSIDQRIVQDIGQNTRFPSLEFGVVVQNADVWARMIYSGANQLLPPHEDPGRVRAHLLGVDAERGPGRNPAAAAQERPRLRADDARRPFVARFE